MAPGQASPVVVGGQAAGPARRLAAELLAGIVAEEVEESLPGWPSAGLRVNLSRRAIRKRR